MIDSAVTPEVVPSAHKDCRRSPQIDEASGRAYVTAMALSAHDIRLAFDALSTELQDIGERSEIVIVGGAALALLFGARETTKDVDAVILTPEAATVRNAVARVADRLHLPEDWLNDGAKGFVVEITLGAVVYESSFLCVRAASTMQLMAMKLAAWRDAVDREDARILLKSIPGSFDEVWDQVAPLVPAAQMDKASYAFEDLWESIHGSR
ncbi:MAG: DUF6036 family nucleotidyltransferase [Gemmatimonadaceae bacterium]